MSDERESSSTLDDKYIPTDTDGIAMDWDGNYAKIPGLLYEINKHCIRKGILQPFLKHGVSLAYNGRTAVPSIRSVPFVQGLLPDGHLAVPIVYSLTNLLPETIDERVAQAQLGRTARGETAYDFTTVTASIDFPVNLMAIEQDNSKLFKVLEHVFGHADESASLLDAASGSGMALARELHRLAALATPADLAVITAHFDSV